MSAILSFFAENGGILLEAIGQHLYMTAVAVIVAILIGIPLGIICTYYKRLAKVILGLTNITQSIPSLAALGLLIPIMGIGSGPAIVMVTVYSLLPIVKNTYTGILNISPSILEAADGVGMKRWERLVHIELPMAFPVMMSGIRIASVTAVGTMTISAYVGGGGLGTFIFEGIGMVNYTKILMGAIPAAMLALGVDAVIQKMEESVTVREKRKNFSWKKVVIVIATIGVFVGGMIGYNFVSRKSDITIGSKKYPEQVLLGHIYSEMIEHNTELKVRRELSIGGTDFIYSAIKNKDIDGYIEYTGSSYMTYLKNEYSAKDTQETVYQKVKEQLSEQGITVLEPLGFGNQWSIGTTQEVAKKYNLETISDLAAVSPELGFVGTINYMERDDGWVGLNKAYNFKFKKMMTAEDTLRYQAVESGQVETVEVYTTDGLISKYNIKVLEDDKKFFAPYDAVPFIRTDTLEQHPELEAIMNRMAGKITEADMQRLNYEVVVNARESQVVAREYLEENNWFE